MNSIFDLEARVDIFEEFEKIYNLSIGQYIFEDGHYTSLLKYINNNIFPYWKYSGTCLSVTEYLSFLGFNTLNNKKNETEETIILYYFEFMINMIPKVLEHINKASKDYYTNIYIDNPSLKKLTSSYFDVLLEKLNYKTYNISDQIRITKRNVDVDSVLFDNREISIELLSYYDIRNKGDFNAKSSILKKIDLYIDKNIQSNNSSKSQLRSDYGFLINKLVNHNNNNKKIDLLQPEEIESLMDNTFTLAIHLLREKEVAMIQTEIAELKK